MRKSKGLEMNPLIKKQIEEMFYQILADIKTTEEAQSFVRDLLNETERSAITKRLAIAVYLVKGRNYGNIRDTLKVSSATIAGVAEMMGNPGIQGAVRKIKANQWAEDWSSKISSAVKKILPVM